MHLSDFKKKIHEACLLQLNERITAIETSINDTRLSSQNETKSSAGDKHETARAMAHLEMEKNQQSLQQLLKMRYALKQSTPTLLETCKGYFYISVALGKIMAENKTVMVISPSSPLGSELINAGENESVEVNRIKYSVISIW
ncbi:MAG: hypothetical protein ACHQF2_11960 [Flavobacteriales bacterium]